jgi:hypothetical protein
VGQITAACLRVSSLPSLAEVAFAPAAEFDVAAAPAVEAAAERVLLLLPEEPGAPGVEPAHGPEEPGALGVEPADRPEEPGALGVEPADGPVAPDALAVEPADGPVAPGALGVEPAHEP